MRGLCVGENAISATHARRAEKPESHLITIVMKWDPDFWMSNTEGKTVIQLLSTSFLIQ